MVAVFFLSVHVVLLVSACFASPRLPLSGKHPRLPRSSAGCELTIYDGSIGSSLSLVRTTSDPNLVDDGWNDRASSAVVSGGCQWILYEHGYYEGNSAVIRPGRYTFSSSPSSVFPNDTLTAVYCLPSEGTPAIVLFEHDHYRGQRRVLTSSSSNLGNFNDKTSTFIITGGRWQLYTQQNYQGSSVTHGQGLYPTANSLTPVANDALTSVKLVGCSNLANPTNGQFSHTGGATFGQTATYSCNTGYNLVGDSTRTCQATGVWSGSAPTCQIVNCSILANPANGKVSHTAGTTFGQTATYSCNTGYNLVGDSNHTCQATGNWSGSAPTCQAVNCGTLSNPANGQVTHTAGTTFGQTATYSCNTGYNLVGVNTRTCQATGVWSGNAPICQVVNCGILANPANGQVTHPAGTTLGQTATYSCNTGFNLVGDNTRTCQATGVWSGNAPICHVVDCDTLISPANGQVTHPAGTTFGQTATYSCNTGYNLVGDNTRTCQATGVWSGNAPTCHAVNCGTLSNLANGRVSHTAGTTFGQTATYSCNTGYNLVGNSTQTCQATGVWSGSAPTCQDINECLRDNGGCHHNCHNSNRSYSCSCNNGYQLNSDGHTCEVPPLPPINLQVSGIGNRTATLTWQAPVVTFLNSLTAVSSYQVMATQEQFANVSDIYVDVDASTTTYTFPQTLEEYTVYTCTVKARNAFGLGNATQPVTLRTLQAAPSSPPQTVSGVAQSPTVLFFTWSPPPPVDINGIILYYEVDLGEMETGQRWTFFVLGDDLRLGSLHPYFTYRCKVAAHNVGRGPFSDPFQLKTLETSPSAPPSNLSIISMNSTNMTLSWDLPPFDQINGHVRHYIVVVTERETASEFQEQPTNTQVTIQSLHPYYTYICRVAAVTTGPGPYTGNLTIQLPEDVPTLGPQSVVMTAINSTTLLISWMPPPFENQNGIIREYWVNITERETGVAYHLATAATTLTVSSLHPFYTYDCIIAAVTIAEGPYSVEVNITMPEDVPSSSPRMLRATDVSSTSVVLTWEAPPPGDLNGHVIGYSINMIALQTRERLALFSNSTTLTVYNLQPYTVYTCVSAAVTSAGHGPFSDAIQIQTLEAAPIGEPTNVTVLFIGPTSIHLSWDHPPEDTHYGMIREYKITYIELETGAVFNTSTDSEMTQLAVNSLHPFYTYTFYIVPVTVDVGTNYTEITIRTEEAAPSGPPQSVSASALDPRIIQINWSQPLPEEQNGIIRSYLINITVAETGQYIQLTTNKTTITAGGLHPYYNYHISVAAVTIARGPYTKVYSLQTPQDVPSGPPTNVQGVAISSTSIRLTWKPPQPEDQNGIIQGYNITITEVATGRMMYFWEGGMNFILIVNSLHPYYTYQCSISAENIGPGPAANVSVTTHQGVPNNTPQNITISLLNATSAEIQWDLPPFEDQNGVIGLYRLFAVEIYTGRVIEQFYTENTSIVLQKLRPFHVYQFVIAASTVAGLGPFSNPSFFQMPESAPGAPVYDFTVEMVYATQVELSWLPPDPQLWNGRITNYTVVYELLGPVGMMSANSSHPIMMKTIPNQGKSLVNNADPRCASVPLQREILVIDDLQEDHVYKFSVFMTNAAGRSGISMSIIQALLGAEPSGTPNVIQISILSSTSIEVQWQPPDFIDQNGIITGYTVILTNMESGSSHEYNTSGDVTVQHIRGLQKYARYYARIAASTVHGSGPLSNMTVFQTYEDTPGPVRNVTTELRQGADNVTAVLSWQPPDEPNGIITQYQVLYAGYNGTQPLDGPYSISNLQTLQFETPELDYGLTYQFKVRASTRVGYGKYSSTVSIAVPTPTTAPPFTVAGSTTDAQQVVDSTGTQLAIISIAVIGWLIVLGMVLLVIVLFYRHKKRKIKYQVKGNELLVPNNIYEATSTPGDLYEKMDNFQASKCAMDEPSTGATLKMAEADEGNPNISMPDPDTTD